jgi:hypothetical protein
LNGLSRGKVGDVFERYVDGKGAIGIGMMDSPEIDKEGGWRSQEMSATLPFGLAAICVSHSVKIGKQKE